MEVLPSNQVSAKLVRGDCQSEQELYGLHRPLLGRPAIESLQLVQRVLGVQTGTLNPVQQLPSLFQGIGKLQGEYTIKLKEGAKPCALTTVKRVAIPLMKPVKVELERMEKQVVISRVSDWCAESKCQVRICVDLTHLNDSVCREQHPLP